MPTTLLDRMLPTGTLAFALLVLCAVVAVVWLLVEPWWRRRQRTRVAARPFPRAWRTILRRRVPLFQSLPADLQLQLKQSIQIFIAEKPFIGCAGQSITDEVRVTIAAQACLLLLNRPHHNFPNLRQILVYPTRFVVPRLHTDSAGVAHQGSNVLSGESWSQGQVVLSWQDVLEGAAIPDDGHNVVLHEFAHQLDQEDGAANGAPQLRSLQDGGRWAGVMQREFDRLQQDALLGAPTLLNPYGATNPAEFFAVATEVFFEQPRLLAQEHAQLYEELARFYRTDPVHWS
ncbi:M90 family metallopeptidase [Rhodoferax sp. GW822-FHT02A01]|uniref:M90 family metallopeptidase n=1 Tax=Rhodoferax sp. GW822-FHT02A01 TaxID=3141537 RepID=UPI00315CE278